MTPPRLARFLLRLVSRPADREFVVQDLQDELDRIAAEAGPTDANRYYRRQVRSSIVPLASARLRAAALAILRRGGRQGWLHAALDDGRQAWRWLWRHAALAATIVLVLGAALASTLAALTVVQSVLLAPLPFPDPDRIVRLRYGGREIAEAVRTVNPQDVDDWRRETRSLSAVSCFVVADLTLTGRGEPRTIAAVRAGDDFDRVLGLTPLLGRLFEPGDGREGAAHVAVLSHAYWLKEFGGDPAALGATLTLNDQSYTVVGVLAGTAHAFPTAPHDIWVPLVPRPGAFWEKSRGTGWVEAVGRLAPATTADQATTELSGLAQRLATLYPASNRTRERVVLQPLHESIVGDVRGAIFLIAAAVSAVLLVACGNVITLLLAHAEARRREFAVRLALGAGRGRLIRQVSVEMLLLAAASAGLGLAGSPGLIATFLNIYPAVLPRSGDIGFSPAVVAWAAALALGLATLLTIAHWTHWRQASGAITAGARRSTPADHHARATLVAAQMALSVLLLCCAALLTRTFAQLTTVDPGFSAEGVMAFDVSPSPGRFGGAVQTRAFFDRVLDEVRALPEVEAVAAGTTVPFTRTGWWFPLARRADGSPDRSLVLVAVVSAGYFDALRIPLVSGRAFTDVEHRNPSPVAIVNEPLARLLGAPADRVRYADRDIEIVGVAGGVRQRRLADPAPPTLYLPYSQVGRSPQSLVVRAGGDPRALLSAITTRLHQIDPATPIAHVESLASVVARSIAPERFRGALLGALAAIAVVLAMFGVWSVTMCAVARQERENGIRLALGEPTAALQRRVLASALRPAVIGAVAGVALSAGAARWVQAFLFGIDARDPVLLTTAGIGLVVLAAVAAWMPARRAARVDPALALRVE